MFFKKMARKAEKKFAAAFPSWSSRHLNREKVEKLYKTAKDLQNELQKIILIDKVEIDSLYEIYCDTDKMISFGSATDDLRIKVNQIHTSSLLPAQKEKSIAEAICLYLASTANHELGFCAFLLTERMSSLQSCSARLVALQNAQKADAKQENPSKPTPTTPKVSDNASKAGGGKVPKPEEKIQGLRVNIHGPEVKFHLKEAESPRP